ncbi:cupin domain-containing protein [Simiduia curdlanivorans]|uniref:Cupin domain-containing protein n=1 Tax=Simiduia curdlanivorans TaxID=1492769 RepID=A0ABV8V7R3_9GAMM|nr:cupin domain-containing protein [Simiduia curdlanivorans]MDN3638419.1 cupin domain-containing protein [Simiduia curdlanivorans]
MSHRFTRFGCVARLTVNLLARALLLGGLFTSLAVAEPASLPVKLTKAQIGGDIFASSLSVATQEASELGPNRVQDAEVFLSSDRKLDAGMYRSGPSKFTVSEPYGVDEFMFFLDGHVTLTSADGSVLRVDAGEAVTIPKAWTGLWESSAYTKIYVIYSPDALLPVKDERAND